MKIHKLLSALALLLLSSVALAGGVITGKVTQVAVRASDGLTYVIIDGTPSSPRASCAAGTNYWIIVAETSDVGHKQFAMLVAAQSSGAQVTIWGAGSCSRWADGEDINLVFNAAP